MKHTKDPFEGKGIPPMCSEVIEAAEREANRFYLRVLVVGVVIVAVFLVKSFL